MAPLFPHRGDRPLCPTWPLTRSRWPWPVHPTDHLW